MLNLHYIIKECVLASNAAIGEQHSLYKQLILLNVDEQVGFTFGHSRVISTQEKSSITIVGCTFVNNTAYHSGGAVSTSGTTLDIRRIVRQQCYNWQCFCHQ